MIFIPQYHCFIFQVKMFSVHAKNSKKKKIKTVEFKGVL